MQHLCVVTQSAHLDCGRGETRARRRPDPDHVVEGLGPAEVVADEADPADPLHENWRFPVRVALDELLIAAELHHVQLGVDDVAVVIEFDDHLSVSLDSGDRIDYECVRHTGHSPISRNG